MASISDSERTCAFLPVVQPVACNMSVLRYWHKPTRFLAEIAAASCAVVIRSRCSGVTERRSPTNAAAARNYHHRATASGFPRRSHQRIPRGSPAAPLAAFGAGGAGIWFRARSALGMPRWHACE